jgi:hypothetical protein
VRLYLPKVVGILQAHNFKKYVLIWSLLEGFSVMIYGAIKREDI